jgi:indole-3-glycerol phosphate synthase
MNVPEHRPNASRPARSLEALLTAAWQRVEGLRPRRKELERRAAANPVPPPFGQRREDGSVGVIAEIKRRSPSAGVIQEGLDPVRYARAYVAGGAVGISVLTEPDHFGGTLADLERVAEAVAVPVLRKDFVLDEVQLLEARAAGAAAVLLIVRALPVKRVTDLTRAAVDLGLVPLVEAHTLPELEIALGAGATLVGINNRDLDTLAVDRASAEALLPRVPAAVKAVAESGLETRADVERMAAAGADHVLVGTAVARSAEPEAAVRALTGVARRPRGPAT